jgi:hypothetical protein
MKILHPSSGYYGHVNVMSEGKEVCRNLVGKPLVKKKMKRNK